MFKYRDPHKLGATDVYATNALEPRLGAARTTLMREFEYDSKSVESRNHPTTTTAIRRCAALLLSHSILPPTPESTCTIDRCIQALFIFPTRIVFGFKLHRNHAEIYIRKPLIEKSPTIWAFAIIFQVAIFSINMGIEVHMSGELKHRSIKIFSDSQAGKQPLREDRTFSSLAVEDNIDNTYIQRRWNSWPHGSANLTGYPKKKDIQNNPHEQWLLKRGNKGCGAKTTNDKIGTLLKKRKSRLFTGSRENSKTHCGQLRTAENRFGPQSAVSQSAPPTRTVSERNVYLLRSGLSRNSQLCRIPDHVITAFNRKQTAVKLSLDLEKAIDKIRHGILLLKMKDCCFTARILKTVRTYFQDRTFHTIVNGSGSSARRMKSGVLQGSAMHPVLFTIYIRNIPKPQDHHVFNVIYVNDTAIVATSRHSIRHIWPKSNSPSAPGASRSFRRKRKRLRSLGHIKSCNIRSPLRERRSNGAAKLSILE
ncbi:hypothetical protein Trydic_g22615 [Trypoxylus dichotomus]